MGACGKGHLPGNRVMACSCAGLLLLVACQTTGGNQSILPIAVAPSSVVEAPLPAVAAPAPPPVVEVDRRWTLFAVGDVLMEDTEAAGIDPFAAVDPPLASADLAVVNVEMAIATTGTPEDKQFTFRAPPSAATTIAGAGVDVASLGNNHSLDYGLEAMFETVTHLAAAGVAPVGAGHDAEEAYRPATFTVKGTRVAVLGASRVFPREYWAAGRPDAGLASAYDEEAFLTAVAKAKESADVVIVNVHWGTELLPCPDEDVVALGTALIEAGASVVVGSHPHVLQPLVPHGGGLIAFSLGNFVFQQRTSIDGDTGVLEVAFDGKEIVDHRLHPHRLDQGPPRPAGPLDAARIAAAVDPAACGF